MSDWPPFSTDEMLGSLRAEYFPGARIALVECEGRRFRALKQGKRAFPGPWEFATYLEPVNAAGQVPEPVNHIRNVVLATTRVGEAGPPGATAAPFVNWSEFDSFQEFLNASTPPPGIDSARRAEQKRRRLERVLGPLELTIDDPDQGTFETLLRWKIEHYGGGVAILTAPKNQRFYRELRKKGIFHVASVRAGGRLVAGKLGIYAGSRRMWRLTAYNPELARYSPGSVLELETLRYSFEAGDTEFDFLHGSEPYKFAYATHVRWIGNLGRERRLERWQRLARWRTANALR